MSYILDALRRADSERDRGAVPDLFAQPLPRVSVDSGSSLGQGRWLWAAIAVLVIALVGMIAWRLTAPASAPASVPPSMPPESPVAQAPVQPVPPPAATAPGLPPQAASASTPTRAPAVPARPARKPARSEVTAAADKPPAASAAESRIYARNELPGEVQRELPTLAIGGASYSENPANRMLIINGQVFHEGDKLAPDLTLEQIKLKAAVLRYKGYRYGVSY